MSSINLKEIFLFNNIQKNECAGGWRRNHRAACGSHLESAFRIHQLPPALRFNKYYLQLVPPAHVVFALFAGLGDKLLKIIDHQEFDNIKPTAIFVNKSFSLWLFSYGKQQPSPAK